MIVIHHGEIGQRLKARYSVDDIDNLLAFLDARGAFHFFPLPTGLYPAAAIDPKAASQSGYGNVWVRDNIYVALALRAAGQTKEASAAVKGLAAFFRKYRVRFEAIVEGRGDSASPMSRPQVRFDGLSLLEIPARWAHAQNDALGYFLWMYCLLAREGSLVPDGDVLALLALYFDAIHF
jgi:phosphorylase kinase alpha/beta subunit